ncbi:hypothetical protein [Sandaracinus amylolyticus]|uniref:TRASH domain-containing protein n=1 Tax=Sandaracinus amylolyticus TaxID=927083 RepID=A0A0F6YGZ3_9BACT|nr:hypothetical protein [Sandaracinus amylolyticus]AKF03426.1 hypothetical protein DB32_000575 [Sandaracinus amylolyticus]
MTDCAEPTLTPLARALADACARAAKALERTGWWSSSVAAKARAAEAQLRGCRRCGRALVLAQPSWRVVEVDGTTFGLFCSLECADAFEACAEAPG